MSDPLALEADAYHTLRGRDRDHLLAAALYAKKRDALPSGLAVGKTVGRLTGSEPSPQTTQSALDALAEAGCIERVDGEPDARSIGVRVTEQGERTLARGATRLDAAATVGGDA